jgi:hypothetical protein
MWSLAYHRPCKVLCGIRIFLVVSHLLFVHNNERGTKLTSRAVKVKYGHRDTKQFNIDLLVELSIPARVTIFLFFYPKNTRATCQKQIRPKRISLYTFSSKNLSILDLSHFSLYWHANEPAESKHDNIDQQGQLGNRSMYQTLIRPHV